MKKNALVVFCAMILLSGCFGGSSEAPDVSTSLENDATQDQQQGESRIHPYGGVLKSVDYGNRFFAQSYINDTTSLATMNVLAFEQDPASNRVLYVGTAQNGIYKSENAGETWERVNFAPLFTEAIAINPFDTNNIYVTAIWNDRGRVFRTDDGGETWRDVYSEPSVGMYVRSVLLAPQNPAVIYAGTDGNNCNATVVKSTDGGATWQSIFTAETNIMAMFFDAQQENVMYLLTESGTVYRSQNAGTTWDTLESLYEQNRQINTEAQFFEGRVSTFVVHKTKPGVLYVGTSEGIYRSEDYGVTWSEEDIIGSSRGLGIRGLAINEKDDSIAYIAGQTIYIRRGGTETWSVRDVVEDQRIDTIQYDLYDERILYVTLQRPEKKIFLVSKS